MSLFPKFPTAFRTSSLPPSAGPRPFHALLETPGDITSSDVPDSDQPFSIEDVLDSSVLDANSTVDYSFGPPLAESALPIITDNSASDGDDMDSERHLSNLHRWDYISVGAFRKTRENLNDMVAPIPTGDYGHAIRPSPLALWSNSRTSPSTPKAGMSAPTSPNTTPRRDRSQRIHKGHKHSHRDRKTNRKHIGHGPVHRYSSPSHNSNQHHQHQHHPNSKPRSASSLQRNSPPMNI